MSVYLDSPTLATHRNAFALMSSTSSRSSPRYPVSCCRYLVFSLSCQATAEECTLNWINAAARGGDCKQGAVPSYYIDVGNHTNVAAAFEFSGRTGVPVVIKNTGNDHMGRSSGPGTLRVWVRIWNLIDVERKPDLCEISQSLPYPGTLVCIISSRYLIAGRSFRKDMKQQRTVFLL
ncbi:hypothetical protein EDD85DRAFT_134526 [Armillaria nabsnona]|nr:hypothetical protein EDD85DRAFT_134526 [Armillaria nabsnona]